MSGFRSLWTDRQLLTSKNERSNSHEANQETNNIESDETYEKNIKSRILDASLNFVPELGWSQETISAGAESIGYPGVIHGLFPNRGADLVHHFYLTCNRQLNEVLKKEANALINASEKNKTEFEHQLQTAVKHRLEMIVPYKKTWPQALGLMALPPNVPKSLANVLTLVDDICYYAGDRSVDVQWYIRRVVLAGIYKTTELYMLQDNSEDHTETWKFLERRIKEAAQISSILSATADTALPEQAINRTTETARAAFTTARNILGLNWNR